MMEIWGTKATFNWITLLIRMQGPGPLYQFCRMSITNYANQVTEYSPSYKLQLITSIDV